MVFRKPRVYAELLPHISDISISLTLPDRDEDASSGNILKLLPSRQDILISYHDQKGSLRLPARALPNNAELRPHTLKRATGERVASNVTSYSLKTDTSIQSLAPFDPSDIPIPWTGKVMSAETRIRCRTCETPFFEPSGSNEMAWKDLPSADWAELMDIWHCHKPDSHEDEDKQRGDSETAAAKGYGAENQTVCRDNTVLVDALHFYPTEASCIGVEVAARTDASDKALDTVKGQVHENSYSPVHCVNCQSKVGTMQPAMNGLALFKSELSVLRQQPGDSTETEWGTYPSEMFTSAKILEQSSRSSASKFLIYPDSLNSTNSGILIWPFNPSVRYSYWGDDVLADSAGTTGAVDDQELIITCQRAMKVLYRHILDLQKLLGPEMGEAQSTAMDHFSLPERDYQNLERLLDSRNRLLPETAQNFRDWKASLLHVFEETE